MRGERDRSTWLPNARAALRRQAYGFPAKYKKADIKGSGETMSFQAKIALRETARDFVVVSSFCFWAAVIGFAPIVAIRLLMS
jgi:hypothetical protein